MFSVRKRGRADVFAEIFRKVARVAKAELLRDLRDRHIGQSKQGLCLIDTGILRIIRKRDLFDLREHFSDITLAVAVFFRKIGKLGHMRRGVDLRTDLAYDFLPYAELL